VTKVAGGLRVTVGNSMEIDLHELTASDRRAELQQLLVGMGRLIETLQSNLTGDDAQTQTCMHAHTHTLDFSDCLNFNNCPLCVYL